MSLKNTALQYVNDCNFAVFPCYSIGPNGFCTCGKMDCKSAGKHPATPRGVLDATKHLSIVEYDWNLEDFNIGIATGKKSGIVVLDVDPKNGGDLALHELIKEIGDFTTYTVRTGSGGLHFYFQNPDDVEIRNSAGLLGSGLDIRGEGGYVIAPPSRHISGEEYKVVYGGTITELPEEIKAKLSQPKQTQVSQDGIRANPSTIPYSAPDRILQGNRNVEITKLAGSLRRIGLTEMAITATLKIENLRICKPPLDDSEINRIAKSVCRYAPDQILQVVQDDPGLSDDATNVTKITTTACYKLGEFRRKQFAPRDVIAFHIARKEWGITAAIKNVGKSTFFRNAAMNMACGKPFPPFLESTTPRKILYLDFETTEEMLAPDVNLMIDKGGFDSVEIDLIDENLYLIPKGLIEGELFTMQKSMSWIEKLCKAEEIEFVIADNLSAGFQVLDESSSGVMNQKVVQPILKFIQSANVGLMLVHHSGKSNNNESYAGRGSSVLEDLAGVGFKMDGDTHNGGNVTISNVKRKDGQGYSEVLRLNQDRRWFEKTTIAPKPKAKPIDVQIQEYIQSFEFPQMVSTKDINSKFDTVIGRMQVSRIISLLKNSGYISNPKKGFFCNQIQP